MDISCGEYQTIQFGIISDKQSNHKSLLSPESRTTLLNQRKELGFVIPEQNLFVHTYKEGIPLSHSVQD